MPSKSRTNRLIIYLLTSFNLLFLIYFLIVGHFNRPALDDYCVMAVYHDHGILGAIPKWYHHWQARIGPHLVNNLALAIYESIHTLLPFTAMLILIFVVAVYRIFKTLLKPFHQSNWLLLNISIFFIIAFLLMNFRFNTFYWVNVSTMYIGGIIAACLGVGELLRRETQWYSYPLIALSFVYAGCSAENFAAVFLLLMTVWAGLNLSGKTTESRAKLLTAYCFLLIAFTLMILAPGTTARRSTMPEGNGMDVLIASAKSLYLLGKIFITEKLTFGIALFILFYWLGSLLEKPIISLEKIKSNSLWLIPAFVIFLWLAVLPPAYAMKEPGPLRAQTHIAFYIAVFIAGFAYVSGSLSNFKRLPHLVLAAVIVLNIYCISSLIADVPQLIDYADFEDRRIKELKALKSTANLQLVEVQSHPNPPEHILKVNELSTDTAWFGNRCYRDGLGLGFGVKTN